MTDRSPHAFWPLVTVAVCTRDNPSELARCLESLRRLDYPALDLLVIDNAPATDATRRLVHTDFPSVRYALEPRPGLNRARNRAIAEAKGGIIAFTDDDVEVDPGWVRALAAAFEDAEDDVMAVTGLVVPLELATDAQVFFENYGGFGCGFERKRYRRADTGTSYHALALDCGTGANMAFRRSLFEDVGPFDPAIGAGTAAGGGGDIEMFFRVLRGGHALVYEPAALVHHRHRRQYARLRRQIASWGSGFVAFLARSAREYPEERPALARLGARWLLWQVRRLGRSFLRPAGYPRRLILTELGGALVGLGRCVGGLVGPRPRGSSGEGP